MILHFHNLNMLVNNKNKEKLKNLFLNLCYRIYVYYCHRQTKILMKYV